MSDEPDDADGLPQSAPRPSKTPTDTDDAEPEETEQVLPEDFAEHPALSDAGRKVYGDASKLLKDFAAALREMEDPACNGEAKIKTKSGQKYKIKYAPLPELKDKVYPVLNEHGFDVSQPVTSAPGGRDELRTCLHHEAGLLEWRKDLPDVQDPQKTGSAITYFRRYVLAGICGVRGREDEDANVAAGNKVENRSQGQQSGGTNGKGDPPTDKQLDYLRSLARQNGVDIEPPETKQEASDMIEELQEA